MPKTRTPQPTAAPTPNLAHALQIGLRASLASFLAAWTAFRLGMAYPIYAVIAAIVVTDSSPEVTRRTGLLRLLGNGIGAVVGAAVGSLLGHSAWVMAGGVLGSILLCEMAGLRGASKITAYVAGIVILFHGDSPWIYAKDRFVETSLGLGFAVLVGISAEWLMKAAGTPAKARP